MVKWQKKKKKIWQNYVDLLLLVLAHCNRTLAYRWYSWWSWLHPLSVLALRPPRRWIQDFWTAFPWWSWRWGVHLTCACRSSASIWWCRVVVPRYWRGRTCGWSGRAYRRTRRILADSPGFFISGNVGSSAYPAQHHSEVKIGFIDPTSRICTRFEANKCTTTQKARSMKKPSPVSSPLQESGQRCFSCLRKFNCRT